MHTRCNAPTVKLFFVRNTDDGRQRVESGGHNDSRAVWLVDSQAGVLLWVCYCATCAKCVMLGELLKEISATHRRSLGKRKVTGLPDRLVE
jgi:hypothetical protein